MVKVFPFRGMFYNEDRLKHFAKVFTPPYDVINEEQQDTLYNQHDFNFIRLNLGKEFPEDSAYNNRYVRAAAFLNGWLRHKILIQDKDPHFYVYEQQFKLDGKTFVRLGFIGLLRLEDIGHGKVYPHEETYPKAKLDRLMLMRATGCNFEPIFGIYNDEKEKINKVLREFTKRKPFIEVTDPQHTLHRLWKIDKSPAIQKIMKEMKDKIVFIADGHHRYEAALRYKYELKAKNTKFTEEEYYNHVMMHFNSLEDTGLVVLPIHRVLHNLPYFDAATFIRDLEQFYAIEVFKSTRKNAPKMLKKILKEMGKRGQEKHVFGLYLGGHTYYLLTLKDENFCDEMVAEEKPKAWKRLDVTILHYTVFDRLLRIAGQTADTVVYTPDAQEAVNMVDRKNYQAAFLLNATKLSEITTIAGKLEKMPHKSTFFYPKLLSGLLLNKLSQGEKVKPN